MAKEEAIRFWWQSAFWITQGSLPLGDKNSVNRDSIVFSRWQHVSWQRFESSGRFQLLLLCSYDADDVYGIVRSIVGLNKWKLPYSRPGYYLDG